VLDAAIVGLGRWGRSLVESVQGKSRRIRFTRGVDSAPDKAREFAARHGFALHGDITDVLADPAIKAVAIVTPHSLHRRMVEAAAAAGKHVFCEKPLALNTTDAAAMIEACRKAGVALGIGHNRRLWPSMQAVKQLAVSGELGELLHIEGHFSNENSTSAAGSWRDSPAESPGGALTATGIHLLDAFINIVGPMRRIHGQLLVRKPAPGPHDISTLTIEFAGGASGTISMVRPTPFFWRVHLFGDKGSAEAIGERELVVRKSDAGPERHLLDAADTLFLELEGFADAVEGRASFHIQPSDMLANIAAFEAAVKALESGTTVAVKAG
jgi:predicted dehydrogenase